ncbi:MAG: outer membrane protein assembly factor BamD, partial [Sphingomonadales bacterium]|nr:outer membrane protein assembly factor BamD [Sphingomonadales bacterium]
MFSSYRIALAALAGLSALSITACAGPSAQTRADTQYVARDVNTLYNLAKDQLDRNRYQTAAIL